jgi:Na+-translocating ferredoxin:NAD+ oxidoreductase subunit B
MDSDKESANERGRDRIGQGGDAMDDGAYEGLRRHLNALPVGFPKTPSGMRILRRLFTPLEARAALGLDWRFRSAAEASAALAAQGIDAGKLALDAGAGDFSALLRSMASKGNLLMRATNQTFALMPFVVGMYELQLARLSRELIEDTGTFMREGYGLELLTTGEAQTRVIPIGAAIRPEHAVADYDESRSLIRRAGGQIAVVDCVCRRGADLAGKPCAATERRELCMVFRDFAATVLREGWGRALSEEEALALCDLNEREGLIMRPSNEREPQFLCACCGDCCGLIAVVKAMKRPADFVATNHRAVLDQGLCAGCGACARRCPMDAYTMVEAPQAAPDAAKSAAAPSVTEAGGRAKTRSKTGLVASLEAGRCIGCGVCVPACKFGALRLEALPHKRVPPRDTEELLTRLAASKPTLWRKLRLGASGLLGLRVRPHG